MDYDLAQFDKSIKQFLQQLVTLAEMQCLDKDAILKAGKFEGRRARVTDVGVDEDGLHFLVRPYRKDGVNTGGKNGDLLWDHPEARSYWRQDDFEMIKDDG